jgi:HSP20 family protein
MKGRDPTVSMWDEALSLLERADRLHRQFFQLDHHRNRSPTWQPPVDVLETEHTLIVIVALPGVSAEQLAISIEGNMLIIRGHRAMPRTREPASIRRLEIPYGQFERSIEFPPAQFQLGERMLKDGCLILTLNKLGGRP